MENRNFEKIHISETIVVEGKDDESRVLSAVDANVICTHGYGISKSTLALIKTAYENCGIIIYTDPDHAGKSIRDKLTSLFPDAKQAYISISNATKNGDIGVENASAEDIRTSLLAVTKAEKAKKHDEFTIDSLVSLGLSGREDSKFLREKAGSILGIGSANTKTFLKRLNSMGITKDALKEALER